MGLVYNNFRVFLDARRRGASFARTLTVGRQQMYVSADEVRRLAREFPEFKIDARSVPQAGEYCETWLQAWLACERIESIDASEYEGATIVHDMNTAIPSQWKAQFSAVIDGGSIEHIYFLTRAIANAMQMTRVGGWLFVSSVANNHCGHGFYQLSPEWFFRTFSTENGFEIGDVLLMPHAFPGTELSANRRLVRVADPANYGGRVGLVNSQPVMIFASARRLAEVELFRKPPQQSDYTEKWSSHIDAALEQSQTPQPSVKNRYTLRRVVGAGWRYFRRSLPTSILWQLQGRQQLHDYRLSNRRVYEPWTSRPPKRNEIERDV